MSAAIREPTRRGPVTARLGLQTERHLANLVEVSTPLSFLRVLEERRFERVGGQKALETGVRVAAANRDLAEMVKRGIFREDLYYRLSVIHIEVPPLRDRLDDVPPRRLLPRRFRSQAARRIAGFAPDALVAMTRYAWPATSANCATPSSAPSSWATASRSSPPTCRPRSSRPPPRSAPTLATSGPLSPACAATDRRPAGATSSAASECASMHVVAAFVSI